MGEADMGARLAAFVSILSAFTLVGLGGCTPKVAVEAPSEPITINLNVKIEHEISVKVDKELDALLEEDDELF